MVAEFGIDSGWLDHPAILERLWDALHERWALRAAAIKDEKEETTQKQFDRMHAKLAGH